MDQMLPEIVRIGVGRASVTGVTPQQVEYFDEAGRECLVDLEECVRNWVQSHDERKVDFVLLPGASEESAGAWNSRCVGQRGLGDEPPWWVEFTNRRRTRMEFSSYEDAYELLLGPLRKAGWHTFDTN